MKKLLLVASAQVAVGLAGSTASAQVSDVEVPTVVMDTGNESAGQAADESIDLANIVQSAAKGVTTVQEAPAIVTVVTSDEIKDRQFQNLGQLYNSVPGWSEVGLAHNMFQIPTVRGQVQAVQFLHDGVSQFDAMINIPATDRGQPMETIKRVEMITGPGGVLWGSNSLLGILNVITKDAEDVEGVEVGSSLGHGNGDRLVGRAYVMAGKSDLLHGKMKAFGHASFETYQGPGYDNALLLFHNPLPQPNSPNTYGPLTTTDEKRSFIVNLDGKLTFGKLQLRGQWQSGQEYKPMGLSGDPVQYGSTDPRWDGITFPKGSQSVNDMLGAARVNRFDTFDQYLVAEYRDRFAKGKAGLTLRGYIQHFERGFFPLNVLAPSQLIQGGLAFNTNLSSYRVGSAFDGDAELAKQFRVLYGAEAFNEWKPTDTTTSIQGSGNQADFTAPYDLTRLPIPCPRTFDAMNQLVPVPGCPQTFAYDASRTVMGAYVSGQIRPNKRLILDGGVRAQVAPESLGSVSYPLDFTRAGTIVYEFIPNWHMKLNFAQGFRPPVFNNTSANGEAVVITGSTNLKVEKSDATQVEVNARIFKGNRRIRELDFRIDGSYTRLKDLIQVNAGSYGNTGDRGVTSAEFLGKLYIQGGHRVELGYTYMRVVSTDRGEFKSLPNHYFNLATVFSMVPGKVSATTNLRVMGAAEDANRLVEYRGASYDPMTGDPKNNVTVNATDLVLDRLPPIADLSVGVTWTPMEKFLVRATVYNALVAHNYQPDVFFDYEPHLEYLPNPYAGIRAYLTALYQY